MEESTWIDILFEESTCIATLFFVIGIISIISAIAFKRGKMKSRLLPLPPNLVISPNSHYGAWPGGIGSLIVGMGVVIDNRELVIIGFLVIVLFALLFMTWKPRWLKPEWVLWLEAHYSEDEIDFMFAQARKEMG